MDFNVMSWLFFVLVSTLCAMNMTVNKTSAIRQTMSTLSGFPYSIIEAAKIDGASDWQIYGRIMLPLCKAGLATVGLFIALNYWNDRYHASLYITEESKYPLQYLLYSMLSNAEYMKQAASAGVFLEAEVLPAETLKMATAIVVTGPILLLYPFIQRYFVKGITIGGVKG